MPDLSTTLHTDMLKRSKELNLAKDSQAQIYGDHWGDPQTAPHLRWIRDNYIVPFVSPDKTICEIGPGGGRWTRYLLGCKKLYAVDYHQELLDELGRTIKSPVLEPIKNNGADFPGIADQSCDYIFSFGVFVHLDFDIIDRYIENIKRIAKPKADIVIQYADFRKERAREIGGFAENYPDQMRACLHKHGYQILEEANELLNHSALAHFTPQL